MLSTRLDPTWTVAAAEDQLADACSYVLADVGDDQAIVIRGRDGKLRAFHNVCRHRGSRILEEPCGTAVRLQCPYHAWVYDQAGQLIRAKHTETLEDFAFETTGLTPMDVSVVDGVVHVRPTPATPTVVPQGLLTDAELAGVRKPYRAASLLPGRAYHDRAVHDFEREQWFRRDWVCVGRVEDAGPGVAPFETQLDGERIVISRDADGTLNAQRAASPGAPVRIASWQGFVFVSFAADPPALDGWLGDLVEHVERFDFGSLRRGHRVVYDVHANWKLIVENYSECYHCPGIHPQLNRLTPYDVGADYETLGAWQGGWMELREGFETMALEDAHRVGPPMCGITPVDERRIDYLVIWPQDCCSRCIRTTSSSIAWSRWVRSGRGSSVTGCSSPGRWPRTTSTRNRPSTSGTSRTARTGTSASCSSWAPRRPRSGRAGSRRTSRPSTPST